MIQLNEAGLQSEQTPPWCIYKATGDVFHLHFPSCSPLWPPLTHYWHWCGRVRVLLLITETSQTFNWAHQGDNGALFDGLSHCAHRRREQRLDLKSLTSVETINDLIHRHAGIVKLLWGAIVFFFFLYKRCNFFFFFFFQIFDDILATWDSRIICPQTHCQITTLKQTLVLHFWITNAHIIGNSFISRQQQQPVSLSTHAENASVRDVGHCTQLYNVSCCGWPTVAELSALAQSRGGYCCPAPPHLKVLIPEAGNARALSWLSPSRWIHTSLQHYMPTDREKPQKHAEMHTCKHICGTKMAEVPFFFLTSTLFGCPVRTKYCWNGQLIVIHMKNAKHLLLFSS